MKNIKFIALTMLLFTCYLQVCAQTRVSNIWSEMQSQNIAVHYYLVTGKPTNITLQYSIDNGQTWYDCKSVTGDLQYQMTGNNTIIWDCRQDGVEQGSLLFKVVTDKLYYKKHVIGLDLGIGARKYNEWATILDVGLRYTHNYSPYIGWDVINFKIQDLVNTFLSDGGDHILCQFMTGLRVYSRNFSKNRKGYASLNAGGGMYFLYGDAGGFACEIETGIYLTKILSTGFVYNFQNLRKHIYSYDDYNVWNSYYFNLNSHYIGWRIGFNF